MTIRIPTKVDLQGATFKWFSVAPELARLFLATHFAFNGNQNVWDDSTSPRYPSLPLPANPSAYEGHENEIPFPEARSIAWLSNLQYWIILVLLALTLEQNSVFLEAHDRSLVTCFGEGM